MKAGRVWAALAVLAWGNLPADSHAMCLEANFPVACTTSDGCPGTRDCIAGHVTPCYKDEPALCPAPPHPGVDLFIGLNAPAAPVGILVDGRKNNAEVDDQGFVIAPAGATATQAVGAMTPSALGNQVLSFAATRAPTRHGTPWTSGSDTFMRTMENTVRVPITVWIVTAPGTFGVEAVQASSAVIQAGALFDQERLGLDFNLIEVRDATGNPNQGSFLNVTTLAGLEPLIGHVKGRFNVYWVPAVNGGSGNGIAEVAHGDSLAVGNNAAPGLLAHELGHNLALDHVDGDARFDGTNVMMSAGGSRLFLTEGQDYRAHIRSISAIRSPLVYGLRPTMPIIDTCNIISTTRNCPKADKRIWADGATWPPN
jgi:hypothetical protein